MAAITGAAIAVGGLALGVYGAVKNDEARGKAEQAVADAIAEIKKVGAPPALAQQIVIDKLKSVGVYTPEVEEALQQDFSNVAQLAETSKALEAQKGALAQFQQRAETGLTAEDRAAFNDARRQVAKEARGRREAVLQDFAARGRGGSGVELLAQLDASQAADEQLAAGGDRIASEASRRALEALSSGSNLATQMYSQDENRARAMDELNRFNVTNQMARQERNVNRRNDAQRRNLEREEYLSDTNIQLGNTERLKRLEQQQQDYKNRLEYAQSISNARTGQAQQGVANAKGGAEDIAGIVKGVGNVAGAAGQYFKTTPTDNTKTSEISDEERLKMVWGTK